MANVRLLARCSELEGAAATLSVGDIFVIKHAPRRRQQHVIGSISPRSIHFHYQRHRRSQQSPSLQLAVYRAGQSAENPHHILNIFFILRRDNCMLFTDHISTGGNAIASVRLSVRPFPFYLSNRLTFGLHLLHVCGSLPWLAGH